MGCGGVNMSRRWGLVLILIHLLQVLDLGAAQAVSQDFFNGVVSAADGCAGKGFYNYDSFTTAANQYPAFATTGSSDDIQREIAAFFANAAHETEDFCFIEEQDSSDIYCDPNNTQYPCAEGKNYHGRGPLQLSWNYNYGAAGDSIQFDGLHQPEIVGTDPVISFKAALWFWMVNSNGACHQAITSGQGFGATISVINSGECDGGRPDQVSNRVEKYKALCQQLGVDPGPNLDC
eukprot:Gb_34557 [translate_table: standard]